MKNLSKKCQYICIIVLLLIISLNQIIMAKSNPIYSPINHDYSASPLVSCPNCSIFFKQEVINVTFDSSHAYMNAYYTFKNNKAIPTNISIILPFSSESLVYNPSFNDLRVSHKGNEIAFSWLAFKDSPILNFTHIKYLYHSIVFNLSFTAYEEKTIHVNYSRNYGIYKDRNTWRYKRIYAYSYLIGTARTWNRSLESAYFEFWVPKNLVDEFEKIPNFLTDDTSEVMSVSETSDYIIKSVLYENWLPSRTDDFIQIKWNKTIENYYFWNFLIIVSIPTFIAIFIKIWSIDRKNKEKITTINIIMIGTLILLFFAIILTSGIIYNSYIESSG